MICFKRTTLYGKRRDLFRIWKHYYLLFRVMNTIEGSTEIPEKVLNQMCCLVFYNCLMNCWHITSCSFKIGLEKRASVTVGDGFLVCCSGVFELYLVFILLVRCFLFFFVKTSWQGWGRKLCPYLHHSLCLFASLERYITSTVSILRKE